jgi:hypothetical protein
MALFNQRLGYTRGEPLAKRPDRFTDLCQGRIGLRQLGFDLIKALIKTLMEVLT